MLISLCFVTFFAKQVADHCIQEVIRHGVPKSIISDHDKIFLRHFWKEFFTMMGMTLK